MFRKIAHPVPFTHYPNSKGIPAIIVFGNQVGSYLPRKSYLPTQPDPVSGVLYSYYGGSVITGYCAAADAEYGIDVYNNGVVLYGNSYGFPRITQLDYGIFAQTGAMVTGTAWVQYANINTNDEDADAATFAYID